ncbi:MAG: DPP IV N-terminal domain-containing protein [Bacteroidota bacterium]
MKRYFSILIGLLFVASLTAQAQKKEVSLEDAVTKQRTTLGAENLSQLNWIPGTDNFAYVKEVGEEFTLLSGNAEQKSRNVLTTLMEINGAMLDAGAEELTRFPRFRWISATKIRFASKRTLFSYDVSSKKIEKLNSYKEGGANHDITPQHGIAYTIDNNLYMSLPGSADMPVTEESDVNIRNGEAAHRFEFGIMSGTFWSPDGQSIAFYRTDENMVTDYPVVKWQYKPAVTEIVKYPFAGDPSHHATIGVYNTKTKKTTFLKTGGDPEHYLTNITWNEASTEIYIAELNRDQNALSLNVYSASTGEKLRTEFKATHDKYIEPKHGPTFIPNGGGDYIWQSQRDGFNHLYRVSGGKLSPITSGDWLVSSLLGFDEKGKQVFYSSTQNSGTDRHVYSTNLKNGKSLLLTPGAGTHSAKLSASGKYLIDSWTSVDVPRTIRIIETKKGEVVQELLNAKDPLADYKLTKPELFTIKAADGKTDLHCRMFKPSNFDQTAKYPVLVYLYNGPGIQLVRNTWMGAAPLWMPWAAEQGYIVFTVDGRGSANRGREFEQSIFRDLGTTEIADQMAGVKWLKSKSWVDGDRMVVHGWSYGGFMTCNMMMREPGTFNAGVAGGPVIDWKMYEVMYTERYMDTPKDNKEGYKRSHVLNYINDLKGKLMLIHGTSDDVVVWEHSIEFLTKAVSEGVQVDYFIYPNHHHNVRGKDRAHLMRKVLDYLMENNDPEKKK